MLLIGSGNLYKGRHQWYYAAKSLQGRHVSLVPPLEEISAAKDPDWILSVTQVCSVEKPQDSESTLYCLYMRKLAMTFYLYLFSTICSLLHLEVEMEE